MGQIMVYRYRPMRVCPTMTTSVVMMSKAPLAWRDIMSGLQGRQQGMQRKMCLVGYILRQIVSLECLNGTYL